jgi:hypothetical protein
MVTNQAFPLPDRYIPAEDALEVMKTNPERWELEERRGQFILIDGLMPYAVLRRTGRLYRKLCAKSFKRCCWADCGIRVSEPVEYCQPQSCGNHDEDRPR